ncbi:homeobox-leucine zipper protein PROTODERMAL FACTOR 2-like [Coffea arabica]|uniref:Homeobox-leucine zipper protein PROTODERMAL FACTOR 2-like n=1 Tax=Coffea arabica TaxID=13443 RepID=A0ABM4UEZ9_COFAR
MQTEAHTKRARNAHLKLENEKLREENIKFKAALINACCLTCAKSQATSDDSLDRHQLRIARLTDLMAKYAGKKYANNNVGSSSIGQSGSANPEAMIASKEWQQNVTKVRVVEEELIRPLSGQTIIDKTTATMLVNSATEELIGMAEIEYPLWIPIIDDKSYMPNQGAYYDMFTGGVWQKIAGFNVEASKGTDIVKMNHVNLAKIFMDTDKWLVVFANIVSRALVLEVISEGSDSGNCNGTLLMMTAEYQALTPTIPTREMTGFLYQYKFKSDLIPVKLQVYRPKL